MNQGKTRFFFTTTVYIADFYRINLFRKCTTKTTAASHDVAVAQVRNSNISMLKQ